jgi:hypothetical protein
MRSRVRPMWRAILALALVLGLGAPAGAHPSWPEYRERYLHAHAFPLDLDGDDLLRWSEVNAWAALDRQLRVLARWKWEKIDRAWEAAQAAKLAQEAVQSDSGASWTPVPSDIDWYAIHMCESEDWYLNSTYDGGLQFHPDTWIAAGGGQYAAYAYLASPAEQIATADRWVSMIGCVYCSAGWPSCGRFA